MNLTFVVGIMGTLAGLIAGWAGTYLAISSATGPKERAFMVRAAGVCWGLVAVVLGLRFLLPGLWPWVPLAGLIVIPVALRKWGDRQATIRAEERTTAIRAKALLRERGLQ